MSKTISFRGEVVDFDLLAMKEQMVASPKPVEVEARENFIKSRRKRKSSSGSVLGRQEANKSRMISLFKSAKDVETEVDKSEASLPEAPTTTTSSKESVKMSRKVKLKNESETDQE